ncbi:MAG: hypothetical protein JWR77_1650 [Rhizorhabdus sp.]|nr:hypothetical protein [Rhizorhabdus sp.]
MSADMYGPLWSQAFLSSSHSDNYDNFVEAQVPGAGYGVRLHRTRWTEPGSGVFQPSKCFIKMHLSPGASVRGGYASRADRPLRDVIFVPQGVPLSIAWKEGIDRGVTCMMDMTRLSEAAGFDWSWPDFDLPSTLCIGNDYLRAGMRRIAEEIISPGFASDVQIECTLTFIALELRRQLDRGGRKRSEGDANVKLSAPQLAFLHRLVIETEGPPPTVAELAAACGISSRQLAVSHRSATGTTLRSFIARTRLERAKTLLMDGRTPIKQISFECGFKSCAAFTAAFRKETGETPRTFRSSIRAS